MKMMPYKDPEKKKEYLKEYNQRPEVIAKRHARYKKLNERLKKQNRESWARHKERINKERREAYKQNPEKVIEQVKKYYEANKEEVRRRQRVWYSKNRERILAERRAYHKQWYADNKERRQEQIKEYRRKNPHMAPAICQRYQARKRNFGGSLSTKQWGKIVEDQDSICKICLEKTKLTIDHIIPSNKWEEWSKENKPSYKFNDVENIQGLCGPCNSSKSDKIIEITTD